MSVACKSNCEPEIRGGTAAERAGLRAETQTFYDLLRSDLDICVTRITVVPELKDDRRGQIRGRRIELEPGSGALFHELCHAVQEQNGLPIEEYTPAPGTLWDLVEEGDPSEVFADFCALGPRAASLVMDDCPGDPSGLELYRRSAALFTGPDPAWVASSSPVDLRATFSLKTAASAVGVETADGGLVIALDEEIFAVDPWTGQSIDHPYSSVPVGSMADTSVGVAWEFGYETMEGDVGYRWLLERSGLWSSLGCASPVQQVFAWDGALWSALLDEGSLTVGVWEAH